MNLKIFVIVLILFSVPAYACNNEIDSFYSEKHFTTYIHFYEDCKKDQVYKREINSQREFKHQNAKLILKNCIYRKIENLEQKQADEKYGKGHLIMGQLDGRSQQLYKFIEKLIERNSIEKFNSP